MSELFSQLGVNWKLLLSQGVNFVILLAVLTYVLWRPLLKIMEERRKKIAMGLTLGEEAARELAEIDRIKAESLARSEEEALALMRKSAFAARESVNKLVAESVERADAIESDAKNTAERIRQEAVQKLIEEAKTIVRAAIVKTVELKPEAVDEALVEKAIQEIKPQRS